MSTTANTSQLLGATTAVGGAIASLPATGDNPLAFTLVVLSGLIGLIVLSSFIVTRVLKRIL